MKRIILLFAACALVHAQTTQYNPFTKKFDYVGGSSSISSQSLTDFTMSVTSSTVLTIGPGRYGSGATTYTLTGNRTFTLERATITSIVTGTTTTLNATGSPDFTNVVNGQSVLISGVTGTGSGCAAINALAVATKVSNTQITVPLDSSAGCTYTANSGTAGANAGGTPKVYGSTTGVVTVDIPTALGAIAYATGSNAVVNQSVTPTVPVGAKYFGTATIAAGSWSTVSNEVAAISSIGVVPDTGINATESGGNYLIGVNADVMRNSATNTVTGGIIAIGASRTAPCRSGAGAPTGQNGTRGDCYFQTDATAGQNLWLVTTTGTPATWTQVSGAPSGTMVQFIASAPSASTTATTSATPIFTGTLSRLPAGGCAVIAARMLNGGSASLTHTLLVGANPAITLASGSTATNVAINNLTICNRPGVQNAQSIAWDINGTLGNTTTTWDLSVSNSVTFQTQTASGTSAITTYQSHGEAPQ